MKRNICLDEHQLGETVMINFALTATKGNGGSRLWEAWTYGAANQLPSFERTEQACYRTKGL